MSWISSQFPVIDIASVPVRLLAAVVLAAILGLEREARQKPAGLRTFALVSLGAAAFSMTVVQGAAILPMPQETVEYDPTGLLGAVAGGIGFLGAGAIISHRGSVTGVTTAAGIWVAGAIGLACGLGQLILAATTTVIAFVVIVGLRYLESKFADPEA